MTNHSSLESLLSQHPRLDEMEILLSNKNLSENDLQTIEFHKFVTEEIASLPKERVPELLMHQLYNLEHKSYKDFAIDVVNDAKQFLPFFIAIGVILVLLNSDLIGVQSVIQNIIILSVGCSFVFYQLLKSKFFVV